MQPDAYRTIQRLVCSLVALGFIGSMSVCARADAADMRTWQVGTNAPIRAVFEALEIDEVVLTTAGGESMRVWLNDLSEADRQYVKERVFSEPLVSELKSVPSQPSAAPAQTEAPRSSADVSDQIEAMFGEVLVNTRGKPVRLSALEDKEKIGVYFSAYWCPPCRRFTPKLVEFYHHMKAQDEDFEIVFVSADRNERSWLKYMKDMRMPWLAVRYGAERAAELSAHYRVQAYPTLVILDEEGKLLSYDGRGDVEKLGEEAYEGW